MVESSPAPGGSEERSIAQQLILVPNLITLARLLCIPLFLWVLFGLEERFPAALILGGLGATDWVDGWYARRYDQVSEVGKILDPTVDRLMMVTAIIALIIDDSVPLWFALATLVREVLISLATLGLAALGARRIDVTWWGKTGTFILMFAFPCFLGAHGTVIPGFWEVLAWGFGIPGLVISWYAAAGYIPIARDALHAGRSAE